MRQSYRDKQSRKSRINQEKQKNRERQKSFKKNNQVPKRDEKVLENDQEKFYEDVVYGRNSVLELLKAGKDINKIFIERGEKQRFYQRNYSKSQTSASCDGGS